MFIFSSGLFASLDFKTNEIKENVTNNCFSYSFVFHFKNTGNYPITIKKISTSCGCTNARASLTKVYPNETGDISGTISLKDEYGEQEYFITVMTDDLSKPTTKLLVTLNKDTILKLFPKVVFWKINDKCTAKTVTLKFDQDLFEIKKIKSLNKNFEVSKLNNTISVVPLSTRNALHGAILIEIQDINSKEINKYYVHLVIK